MTRFADFVVPPDEISTPERVFGQKGKAGVLTPARCLCAGMF
jgi:hypothetical protein